MEGGVCMAWGHAWWGGMHDRGHVWQGGMHGGGHAWQEKWQLQWAVHILLECILLINLFKFSKMAIVPAPGPKNWSFKV